MAEKDTLLTAQQFADRMQVTAWTVLFWARTGKIRSVRIGRSVRIPESELEQYKKVQVNLK